MNPAYIKAQLKVLDRNLRQYRTREDKLAALEAFQIGVEETLHEAYPIRFNKPDREIRNSYFYKPQGIGKSIALDLDSLSAGEIREQILSEVEKRKARLTNPNLGQKINDFLEGVYKLYGQIPRI